MQDHAIPFSRAFDRADALRKDAAALDALWAADHAKTLVFWRGKPLLTNGAPTYLPVDDLPSPFARLFLGRRGEEPVLAVALDPSTPAEGLDGFTDLRRAGAHLSLEDAALLGTARSVFAWHRTHRFCANCGSATTLTQGGWRRDCPDCSTQHFPRVDPVVIALVTHNDRVLLGRGPSWPPGFFSCLAGFVEPGETPESATRREVAEEAGVRIGAVRYLASQPWPFPRSLMLGVHAEALDDHIEVDGVELAEARWFTRSEVTAIFDGTHPEVAAPFPVAIAHHLLRVWLDDTM